jgi:hypothetical protein
MIWLIIGGIVLLAILAWPVGRGVYETTLDLRYPDAFEPDKAHAFKQHRRQCDAAFVQQVKRDSENQNPRWLRKRLAEMRGERRGR